jgi:hypothetical protein
MIRTMNTLQDVLDGLETIRAETLKRFEPLTQEQLDWHPPDNEWSLGEIFHHIALDEHYLREQIARPLMESVKPPDDVTFIPPPPFNGAKKEVIEFWFSRARTMTRRMIETWPADGNVELTHIGGLTAMNSLGWLEGYGGHEAFHHKQIDSVIAQWNDQHIRETVS